MKPNEPGPFLQAVVHVDYPKLRVNVEIAAEAGQVVGLVGPNGAGKTTVLRSIAGLQPLDRGRILLNGAIVDAPASNTFVPPQSRRVGVVFQDYRLFPHMTALENVVFGLLCSTRDRSIAHAKAAEWLARFDLIEHSDHKPSALSGGQAQRVALARALAIEPEVLLLDEPLAAIDPEARSRIRDDLRRHLAQFAGVTVLVSHDYEDIRDLADKAVVMQLGAVAWSGPTADLR